MFHHAEIPGHLADIPGTEFAVVRHDRWILFASHGLQGDVATINTRSGHLRMEDAAEEDALSGALARLTCGRTREEVLEMHRGDRPLELRLTPLYGANDEPVLLMIMRDRKRAINKRVAWMQGHFGLTVAETHLLAALCAGRTTSDASREFGVSRTTIRTHLQHIFDKCGVRSQLALKALVLASAH